MKELVLKRNNKGVWYVRPYLGLNTVTGKPLRPYKCFPEADSEADAMRAAEAWAAGIANSADLNVRKRMDDLLPRFVTWLDDTGAAVNTIKTYRSSSKCLIPFFADMDPDDVSSFDVELIYAKLMRDGSKRGRPLSANTINKHHGFLSAAYTWMLEKGICTRSPMPHVRKPARERSLAFAFTDMELDTILSALRGVMDIDSAREFHVADRNMACAAYTAAFEGIREGEACGLDRGDINWRRKTLIVSTTAVVDGGISVRQNKTKGKRTRCLPISPELLNILDTHISWMDKILPEKILRQKSAIPLFCDAKGKRLKPSGLSVWFRELCSDLGLPSKSHFHTLRHTFASILLDSGADLRTIADLLGHAREGFTLETYAHMMPGRDRAAVELFAAAVENQRGRDP